MTSVNCVPQFNFCALNVQFSLKVFYCLSTFKTNKGKTLKVIIVEYNATPNIIFDELTNVTVDL